MSFEKLEQPTEHNMKYPEANLDINLWFVSCEDKSWYYLHRDGELREGTATNHEASHELFNDLSKLTEDNIHEVFTGYYNSLEEATSARDDYYSALGESA